MLPMGSSSRRLLNQSTHSSVANSTASNERHGPRRWTRCRLVADGGLHRLAADHALQAHALHQPCDSTAGDVEALPLHLPPDLAHAVDAEVLVEHPPHLLLQHLIPLRARRTQPRSVSPVQPIFEAIEL